MNKPTGEGTLREKAEKISTQKTLEQSEDQFPYNMTVEQMRSAMHELQVHKIELEMQNEELRDAQAEIESMRARYFDLYDRAPVGYFTLSDKSIILEANLAAADLFGAIRNELIGNSLSKYIYREDQDSYYLYKLKLFEENVPQSLELRINRCDGTYFWADINASILLGTDGQRVGRLTMSDITERKQTEEKLLIQSNLLSSVHDAIIAVDMDKNILYWNKSAESITGWTEAEIVGECTKKLYEKFFVDSQIEEIVKRFYRDGFYIGEVTAKKKNGEIFISDLHLKGVIDAHGQRRGTVASFRDITEYKKTNAALRESEQHARELVKELRQVDKSKNEFFGALSHEFRNPLAAISAGLQLLDITNDEKQKKSAKSIMSRQIGQLCRLVDDLLDITRIVHNKFELKKEKVELTSLAILVIEDQKPLFDEKAVNLSITIKNEPMYLEADPTRLKQIIGNLLNNALKYTEIGGNTVLCIYTEGKDAVISIKDDGKGIAPEYLPELFKPFVQVDMSLDRSWGGLGLGLSITKGIVELHGGCVKVFSEGVGKGAEFLIKLPIKVTVDQKRTIEIQENETANAIKIFIIEDNKDFAELLNSMLTTIGYDVNMSHNGKDGVLKVKQFKPDVVFCDVGLPDMDGYECAKTIRTDEAMKDVILIALTGYTSEQDIKRAIDSGFNTHLSKPVDLLMIQQILKDVQE